MESTNRPQPCPCSYKEDTDSMGFQKIVESEDGGLAIYRHVSETHDALHTRPSGNCEAFILRNTKNVTSEDLIKAFEQNKMTCPRCIKSVKHAQSLITNVQLIDTQEVLGVCDHCRLKERSHHSCCRCNEVINKFKTNTSLKVEVQRQRVKKWLAQVQRLLRNALADEIEQNKLKIRARSELSLDKLVSECVKSESKYDKAESRARGRLETSDQRPNTTRTLSSEKIEGAYTVSQKYFKRVVSPDKYTDDTYKPSFSKLPEDKNVAVNNLSGKKTEPKKIPSFLETSDEYAEYKPKRKKSGILKSQEVGKFKTKEKNRKSWNRSSKDNILKARSEQDLSREATAQDFILKSNKLLEDAFMPGVEKRRSLSPEMPWLKSASEQDLSRGFSFLFPKEKIELKKRHVSSSELIKDLQDTLKTKAEEKKRKKEEQIQRKREEQERKKLENEEKIRIESEKKLLADKEEQMLQAEKLRLSKTTSHENSVPNADKITSASSYVTEKMAEKEAQNSLQDQLNIKKEDQTQESQKENEEKLQKQKLKEQKNLQKYMEDNTQKQKLKEPEILQKDKEDKIQKQKLKGQENLQNDNGDKIQKQKLKGQESLQNDKEDKMQKKKLEGQNNLQKDKVDKIQKQKFKGQEHLQKDKEDSIQKPKLKGEDHLQDGKEDKIQKQKLEGQDRLKKERDPFKRDRADVDNEAILAEKSKIDAQKLSEKETQKTLKDQQQKEREEQVHKAKKDKLNDQEKVKRDKADNLQNQTKNRNKDNFEKNDTPNANYTSKTDDKTEKAHNEKKMKKEKQSHSANNEALKSLLALQTKDKAEREKLKKQQEIEKELAEKKAMEAEKVAKVGESKKAKVEPKSKSKNKEGKYTSEKPERAPSKKPESPTTNDLDIKKVKVRKISGDDLILRLVQLKQSEPRKEILKLAQINFSPIVFKKHARHKCRDPNCPVCRDSDLGLAYDDMIADTHKADEINHIIIGEKIYKNKTPFTKHQEKNEKEPTVELIELEEIKDVNTRNSQSVQAAEQTVSILTKPLKGKNDMFDPEASKGVIRYALSDRTFIDKGWTLLPTEKVVRKMNVYRMRPAHPEFDWFEHNKAKRVMQYDTGEKLAEFDDNGRGRWFYRSGKLALDYYDAEEINAQQRFVVYSSGELDERGRTRPRTILATFDYLGNGIVFDHAGKIRLKYNQTEGVVLDRSIGPVSQWKWHTLNDPPVLQQVMIDTQMPYKDPTIMKLGGPDPGKKRVDNEEMLAIEFDNFIKEKSRKLTQKFKPFQIKMKALKINEYFSLRVLDQATVYLLYRDGTTNLKINMGMVLDHKEIVDTDIADVGDVSNSMERFPARTDSLAVLQQAVAQAQREERSRVRHERRLHKPAEPCASADQLTAATSRPLRPPLVTASSSTTLGSKQCPCKLRKPSSNLYYDTRL